MDQDSWDVLNQILKKEPAALTEGDIIFLKARKNYLDQVQTAIYESVLNQEQKKETDLVPYRELQRKANSLGIKSVGVPREELEVAIRTVEQNL